MTIFNTLFFEQVKTTPLLKCIFDYQNRDPDYLNDYIAEFEDEEEEDIVKDTKWLYKGSLYLTVILGIYKDKIIAINEDFFLVVFCNHIQDIPFEIYRRGFSFFEKNRDEHLKKLNQYEQWCRDNGIAVDPDNHYHDEHGNIFSEYFELDYDQSIIGLY